MWCVMSDTSPPGSFVRSYWCSGRLLLWTCLLAACLHLCVFAHVIALPLLWCLVSALSGGHYLSVGTSVNFLFVVGIICAAVRFQYSVFWFLSRLVLVDVPLLLLHLYLRIELY